MIRLAALVALLTVAAALPASAQMSVLANLEIGPKSPTALVQVRDGIFYGVSERGGLSSLGSVFILYRRSDGSWGTFTLFSFTGANGQNPRNLVLGPDGNFYGTTNVTDGSGVGGTVFRITPFGALTTLHTFPLSSRPSRHPLAVSDDGFLWGTTCSGDGIAPSSVFRLTTAGGFSTIYRAPVASRCLDSVAATNDGQLMGLSSEATSDTSADVQLFRLTRTGVLTPLRTFNGRDQSMGPMIRGNGGIFYAFLVTGPAADSGRIIGARTDGTVVLDAVIPNGRPETLVEGAPGVLFGTTAIANTFFRLGLDGEFTVTDWSPSPIRDVVGGSREWLGRGIDGRLYGASFGGGPGDGGVVFSVDLDGTPATISYMESGPLAPTGALVESAGAFYGTSCAGGMFNRGTVFRVTPAGAVTVVHSFADADGWCPLGLHKGPDGHFYGNTYGGTIFRITTAGTFTRLYTLPLTPPFGLITRPPDSLTIDADGNLWGISQGPFVGYVYRLTPSGVFTSFDMPPGSAAGHGVVFGADGNLYGVVYQPAPVIGNNSQLFRMTPAGTFTFLETLQNSHVFLSRLLPASDGKLYGVATQSPGLGASIFHADTDGQLSALTNFDGHSGWAPLIELPNGELAGVAFGTQGWRYGGEYIFGSVFVTPKSGAPRTVHRFSWIDGANPFGALVLGSDGALYGTTFAGGLGGGGVVFRIQ